MTAPAGVDTGTVTGTIVNDDGTPAAGTVKFTPEPPRLLDTAGNVVYVSTTQTVTLDELGAFTVELIATDAADVTPTGWTYGVYVETDEPRSPYSFRMYVPAGAVTPFADVTPAPPGGGDGQQVATPSTLDLAAFYEGIA